MLRDCCKEACLQNSVFSCLQLSCITGVTIACDRTALLCMQVENDNLKENPLGLITKKIADKWSENVGVDFIQQMIDWSTDIGNDEGFISSLINKK